MIHQKYTNMVHEKFSYYSDLNKKIGFNYKGQGFINIDTISPPSTISGKDLNKDVNCILSSKRFKGLFEGSLNRKKACMEVTLKIEDDMSIALKLADIF